MFLRDRRKGRKQHQQQRPKLTTTTEKSRPEDDENDNDNDNDGPLPITLYGTAKALQDHDISCDASVGTHECTDSACG